MTPQTPLRTPSTVNPSHLGHLTNVNLQYSDHAHDIGYKAGLPGPNVCSRHIAERYRLYAMLLTCKPLSPEVKRPFMAVPGERLLPENRLQSSD